MALDGIYLNCLKNEIASSAIGMRVEKVYQPSKEEIVLALRGRNGTNRLLLSARANSPRIHFTAFTLENPQTPPMLCMLLRKHLTGAVITDLRQIDLDRILFIDFDATNEIGDKTKLSLCVEIMAQHSNIILIDENNNIIDALKRVDMTMSSVRQILPSLEYEMPPVFDKIDIRQAETATIVQRILLNDHKQLSSACLATLQGISPIVAREIAFRTWGDDCRCGEMTDTAIQNLAETLNWIKDGFEDGFEAFIIKDANNKPFDFSFLPITQYDSIGTVDHKVSFSALLDEYYHTRDHIERIHQHSSDLFKMVNNLIARTAKKIALQKSELEACADRENLRISAELISANQYRLPKGAFYYDIENYYDNNQILRIKADPALSPTANSQKYYKDYRKAKTAEQKLTELIVQNEQELTYLESVLDELNRSANEAELSEIREELFQNGYGKKRKNAKGKKDKALPPREYVTDDGFTVLVGRNNIQNDYLTFKLAHNNDMWLHTKNVHGSHVVILSKNGEISDNAIEQASIIAAYHSKAGNSSLVPVDYTLIKNIKKPPGAKSGKVIYHEYFDLIATPDETLVKKIEKIF